MNRLPLEPAIFRAPFDTSKSEKLRIFISSGFPQPSRIAVFVLDMNGAAGSSRSQASKAGSRIGFCPKGRRIYEEPWQMDVGRSNRTWRHGPSNGQSPSTRIQGRH